MKIAPSMLACDQANFKNELDKIQNADYIHLDIMDGHFVPNISFGPDVVKKLRPHTNVPFDVHLMISHPLQYIEKFKDAGADIVSFHIECEDNTGEVIDKITSLGIKPALTLKPKTAVETIYPYADKLFMVLIMSVEPGFGGQSFMPEQLEKVRKLKEKFPHLLLEIDGGIGRANIELCKNAGVDICVAGTSVFTAEVPSEEIEYLQKTF